MEKRQYIKLYEKPVIKKLQKMNFPVKIINSVAASNGSKNVVCHQCSSCHNCR